MNQAAELVATAGELIPAEPAPIAVYDEFRAQLAELKEENAKAVFDYADEAGSKEARSHIYSLRRTKTAVDNARKAEKKASLEYGRRVDSEAKEIIEQIEDMIEVHAAPIRELEEAEKARRQHLEHRLNGLMAHRDWEVPATTSAQIRERIEALSKIPIDASWQEFEAEAERYKETALDELATWLETTQEQEALNAELEKFRQEKAQREQEARDKQIAEDAEQATLKKIADDREAEEAAERKRSADRNHRAKINREAAEAFQAAGMPEQLSVDIITLIVKGRVPNVSIKY